MFEKSRGFVEKNGDKIFLFCVAVVIAFLMLAVTGCSTPKRAAKAIERIGANPIALALTKSNPELLKTDTVRIDSILNVPVTITTETIIKDTIIDTQFINTCKDLQYRDANIFISVKNGSIKYKILSKQIKDTVTTNFKANVFNGITPQQKLISILENDANKLNAEIIKYKDKSSLWKKRFFILLLITLTGALLLLLKNMIMAYLKTKLV